MDATAAAHAYRAASLENAPPIKIVRMLYAGALRFLERARRAAGSPEYAHWIGKADAIVKELRCSLDHSHDAKLSGDLESLYVFVEGRLSVAQIQGRVEAIGEAERVLETLASAWNQVQVAGGDGAGA